MDYNSPGFSVHGILQGRILEWVAIPSRGSSQSRDSTCVSYIAGRFFTNWATGKPSFFYTASLIATNFHLVKVIGFPLKGVS